MPQAMKIETIACEEAQASSSANGKKKRTNKQWNTLHPIPAYSWDSQDKLSAVVVALKAQLAARKKFGGTALFSITVFKIK